MKDLIKFFFNKLDSSEELLNLNFGTRKKIILIFIDLCLSLISCGITYILDSNISEIFDENNKTIIFLIFFSVIFLTSIYVNLYELPIKEQDIEAYIRLFFYSSISFFCINIFSKIFNLPIVNFFFLTIVFVTLSLFVRFLLTKFILYISRPLNIINVAIIGIGDDAKFFSEFLSSSKDYNLSFFFVDQNLKNSQKRKKFINKVPILYEKNFLIKRLKNEKIKKIFISENLKENLYLEIKDVCVSNDIEIQKITNLNTNLSDYIFSLNKDHFYEEIFENKETNQNILINKKTFENKTILITGGAGTIGNSILKHVSKFDVNKIYVIDNSEFGIYKLNQTFQNNKKVINILGSINDESFLNDFFLNKKIDIVFHAAAYKHVSIVENNPIAALSNNIFSTENLLKIFIKKNVEKFVLISSDKAVQPTNLMGITKRICELLAKKYSTLTKINQKIISVRFGNVAGSSGSVIPLFLENIKKNEDLIVKGEETNRYFMSTDEASFLVAMSLNTNCENGDVLFLDMGKSFNIKKLAEKILSLFPHSKSKIVISNLDYNEKVSEKLIYEKNENSLKTNNSKIFIAKSIKQFDIISFNQSYDSFLRLFKKNNQNEISTKELLIELKKCLL